ncbi:MAG: hypothetical protein ACJ8GN_03745 [Longimicrobiaceae bacterium]
MNRARPDGFGFLAMCALACACVMAGSLGLGSGGPPPVRFAVGATGALALVTAEALAYVRPWAFGASLAFAGTFFALLGVMVPYIEAIAVLAVMAGIFILIALVIVFRGMCSLSTPAPRLQRRRVP